MADNEANDLRDALSYVLSQAQQFESDRLRPATLVHLQIMSQNIVYTTGITKGYDWRDIHLVARPNPDGSVSLVAHGLSPRADQLLNTVMQPPHIEVVA